MLGFGVGRGGRSLWTPKALAPRAWFRADRVTLVSGAVSAAEDLSGNGWTASQATAGKRPGYSASDADFNGRPTMLCYSPSAPTVRQDLWLMTSTWASIAHPLTVLLVARRMVSNAYFFDNHSSGAQLAAYSNGTDDLRSLSPTNSGTGGDPSSTFWAAFLFDGPNTLTRIVRNGTTYAANSPGASASVGLTIGDYQLGGAYGGAKIAEIAVVPRYLSAGEIAKFASYCARYGL